MLPSTHIVTAASNRSGARESNAGDEFHVLWAARRALKFLSTEAPLTRLVMEDLSPTDRAALGDAADDDLLTVDLTEYYGGDDLHTANRVVISQLKYSTRHPTREWTSARLCQADTKSESVFRKFARAYHRLVTDLGREIVGAKLQICLVSNQPIHSMLQSVVKSAQAAIAGLHGQRLHRMKTLLDILPADQQTVLQALQTEANLSVENFGGLLSVLDFSNCGQESRELQRLQLLVDIGPMFEPDPQSALRSLCDLLRSQAMPESRYSPGISKVEVLACLGVYDSVRLFPAPSHIEKIASPVETSDIARLATLLQEDSTRKILAHGGAGVGKTTTLSLLEGHLPAGSSVLYYDCFGGGAYLDLGKQRHSPQRAYLQIINELARTLGTAFLIQPPQEAADLELRLVRSIEAAAKLAGQQGGLFVLAIDAADNANLASAVCKDTCFVPALWRIRLPQNARLVMSSRTHRREALQASSDVVQFALEGFGSEASTAFLHQSFPSAEDPTAALFHVKSGGNPRVQYYWRNALRGLSDAAAVCEAIRVEGTRTPENQFQDWWENAFHLQEDSISARTMLANLLALTRPTSVEILSKASQISSEAALSFCQALVPGLVVSGSSLSFRDEDFETYLRGQVNAEDMRQAHSRLADYYVPRESTESEAARVVADHLFAAGRYEETIHLALAQDLKTVITDEVLRSQTRNRRVNLALRAAAHLGRQEDVVRLLMLAAEAARSTSVLTTIIRDYPHLALQSDDFHFILDRFFTTEPDAWLGSNHLELAAVLARDPERRERAWSHFQAGEAWITRFITTPEEQRHGRNISAQDIAHGAEALYWLRGPAHAGRWLASWEPEQAVQSACYLLFNSLARQLSQDAPKNFRRLQRWPVWVQCAALTSQAAWGKSPSPDHIQQTLTRLEAALVSQPTSGVRSAPWLIPFCEYAILSGAAPTSVQRILGICAFPLPTYLPNQYTGTSDWTFPLRAFCLRAALNNEEVTRATLRSHMVNSDAQEHRQDQENYRYDEALGKVVPIFVLHAEALTGRKTEVDTVQDLQRLWRGWHEQSAYRSSRGILLLGDWIREAARLIVSLPSSVHKMLVDWIPSVEPVALQGAPYVWVDMAERLIRQPRYQGIAFNMLERATQFVIEHPYPSGERWKLLARCADIATPYDTEISLSYYREALRVAGGIDDDCAVLITLQAELARQITDQHIPEDSLPLAWQLARNIEAHETYVSEKDHLPWSDVLRSVAGLAPSLSLALCGRWEDEARCNLTSALFSILPALVKKGNLPARQGFALLCLVRPNADISQPVITLLEALYTSDRISLSDVVPLVCKRILCEVALPLREEAARHVLSWAEGKGMRHLPGLEKLSALVQLLKKPQEESQSRENEDVMPFLRARTNASEGPALQSILDAAYTGSLDAIADHLHQIEKLTYSYEPTLTYLRQLGEVILPAQRCAYLDQVIGIHVQVHTSHIAGLLRQHLERWRSQPDVRTWMDHGIPVYLRQHIEGLVEVSTLARADLEGLLRLYSDKPAKRLGLLVDVLTPTFDSWEPRQLYDLSEMLNTSLDVTERESILRWSLNRSLTQAGLDPLTLTPPIVPSSTPDAIAGLLWVLLGHPERNVRWRALHAGRLIFPQQGERILASLITLSTTNSGGAFCSPTLDFYAMSAREWLAFLLLRVSGEHPALLLPHVTVLCDQIFDPAFPHALIREFTRRMLVRLNAAHPGLISADINERLQRKNVALACRVKRGRDYSGHGNYHPRRSEGFRFHFDSMDTLPYWYDPLGDVFHLPVHEIASRAERWIVDQWGRTDLNWRDDQRAMDGRYGWEVTSHRHGSIPRVENLRLYLEYHAMMLVAGELIDQSDTYPIVIEDYIDSDGDTWQSWLERWQGDSDDGWLADTRSAPPLQHELWGDLPELESWLRRDVEEEYIREIGFKDPQHMGQVVVLGEHEIHDRRRHGSMQLRSALVTPETARSLLHALQATEDPHNYALPVGGSYAAELEIAFPGMELRAWVSWEDVRDGFEEYDERQPHIGSFNVLGPNFMQTMDISQTSERIWYKASDGQVAGQIEIWNDVPQTEETYEACSSGQRLWVRYDLLLDYMRQSEMDLIFTVHLSRHRRERDSSEYDLGRTRVYLLRRNGTLEALAARGEPRSADRSRTRRRR